jgi:drug/metabolite transporter (DMT)-like permease
VVAYYRALKRGSASLVAPIAAAGLILPVTAGVVRGERTALFAALGTAVLLAGITLLARARGTGARADRTAILLAVLAAASFGSYFVVLDAATGGSGDPLWIAGLVAVGSASAAVPARLKLDGITALAPPTQGRAGVVAVGLLLALADVALTAAMAGGDVALVSVISSSDPAITARLVLAERVSRGQGAGLALALTGLLAVAAA